jgi:mannitol-specific phosphotransferase system IIBC component
MPNKREKRTDWNHGLQEAASNRELEAVQELVKEVVNVKAKDNLGRTVLHEAVKKGNVETVEQLLKAGEDTRSKDIIFGKAALRRAAKKKHSVVVKLLLKDGANVEATVLHDAAESGCEVVVQLLVDKGLLSDGNHV